MCVCVLLAVGWVALQAEAVSSPSPKHGCLPSGKEKKAAGECGGTSKAAGGLSAMTGRCPTSWLGLGFPWHTKKKRVEGYTSRMARGFLTGRGSPERSSSRWTDEATTPWSREDKNKWWNVCWKVRQREKGFNETEVRNAGHSFLSAPNSGHSLTNPALWNREFGHFTLRCHPQHHAASTKGLVMTKPVTSQTNINKKPCWGPSCTFVHRFF